MGKYTLRIDRKTNGCLLRLLSTYFCPATEKQRKYNTKKLHIKKNYEINR